MAVLIAGIAAWVAGCFQDVQIVTRRCPVGDATCACAEDGTCSGTLTCTPENICRNPRCQDGQEGCACIEGTCDAGLVCIDDSCLPPEGMTSGATDDSSSSGPPMGQFTSGEATTTEPIDDTGSTTGIDTATGGVTSEASVSAGPTSSASDTDPETTGSGGCGCGWLDSNSWYDCGIDLPPADPSGVSPPDCPPDILSLQGLSCNVADPEVTVTGCCQGGLLAFCATGDSPSIIVSECTQSVDSCTATPP